jgi:hypothetical protein
MEAKILSFLARRDSSGKIERVDESVRLRVANRFRSEVMVEEIEKVYDQELKGRKTSGDLCRSDFACGVTS